MTTVETASIGKTVAVRVGSNIREVRTKLNLTQAQIAAPEFSISYISAIERGKIRPSLKALSILAKRLDVPLTFLLEGKPEGLKEARAVGYSPADSGPDQKIDLDLLQASILVQQRLFGQAGELLSPIQADRISMEQAYRLFFLRGQIHLGQWEYQEAIVDLRAALTQGEGLNDIEYTERVRNELGTAYSQLHNYTLALENHLRCSQIIENGQIADPMFALTVFDNLARDYSQHGDYAHAVEFFQRALTILDGLKRDAQGFARKYMEIGQKYKALGKFAIAREYMGRSLAIYEMGGEQRLVGLVHQRLGQTLEKQSDEQGAEREYRLAIEIEQELNEAAASSVCHTSLAELLLKQGRRAEAEREAQTALNFAQTSEDTQAHGLALIVLAKLRYQVADYAGADELFQQAFSLLESAQAYEHAAHAAFHYANLLEQRNEIQRSLATVKRAYAYINNNTVEVADSPVLDHAS